jgi:Ca2+-binding EF-hand superfamily protein
MQFSKVWRNATGQKGNLFLEMKYFSAMDTDNSNVIDEDEFLAGWIKIAREEGGGESLLRRLSMSNPLVKSNDIFARFPPDIGQEALTSTSESPSNSDLQQNGEAMNTAEDLIRSIFQRYAKVDDEGKSYMNVMLFSKVWREVTGEQGNVYNEMKNFNLMDTNNNGFITEEEFVIGWMRLAAKGGDSMIRRLSDTCSPLK